MLFCDDPPPYGWEPAKICMASGKSAPFAPPAPPPVWPRSAPYHHYHLWRGYGGVQHRVHPRGQRPPGPPAADLGTLPLRLADCRRPGQSDGLSGVYGSGPETKVSAGPLRAGNMLFGVEDHGVHQSG